MTDSQSGPEGGGLILILERDPHVRELQTFFLNQAGYSVEFADDGMSALELVSQLRPHLVIAEVLIPRLDGLALCRRLKNDPEHHGLMVMIFSILAAAARSREAGADAFLLKPLAERRLLDCVEKLMKKRAEVLSGETTA
jgi:DNA-binding response OmpR family regulator